MYSQQIIQENLLKVASNLLHMKKGEIKEVCPIGIIDFENWEWPQGVGLYGLYKYYQITGNKEIFDILVNWYDRHLEGNLPEKNVNTMAPMLTLAFLYHETKEERYGKVLTEWAEWVMREMPRTKEGGIQHIVTGETNEQQLWIDTLFMTVLFIAKMGMILNKQEYIDESIKQFLIHIKYLADKKTGFWFHGWTFIDRNNFADALWARGNCWYTAGVVDYIEIIGLEGGVKQYLLDTLIEQVDALVKHQREDGMWHTLLDDHKSYVETSATAGFGYGILKAVRMGFLDKSYLSIGQKAMEAVLQRISTNGTVEEVSYGTGMGKDLDHYKNIPICPMAYGQALTLLLLGEGLQLNFNV